MGQDRCDDGSVRIRRDAVCCRRGRHHYAADPKEARLVECRLDAEYFDAFATPMIHDVQAMPARSLAAQAQPLCIENLGVGRTRASAEQLVVLRNLTRVARIPATQRSCSGIDQLET